MSIEDKERPLWAVAYRLVPFQDGNKWCVLLGESLATGIAGFGDTPELAIYNFERAMAETSGSYISPEDLKELEDSIREAEEIEKRPAVTPKRKKKNP